MHVSIEGGAPLRGELSVPADKSITHRALMLSSLADGDSSVTAYAAGEDNHSTASVFRALGVQVDDTGQGWRVRGVGLRGLAAPNAPLDCGNSGTTMRLMCGLLAGSGLPSVLVGDESLGRRPMGRVCNPLRELGADIAGETHGDRELPPVSIRGPGFAGGAHRLSIASAQVKSAVLLASLTSGKSVVVHESAMSRDHTERMLVGMGASVTRNEDVIELLPPKALRPLGDFAVPGDFSSAAFWLAAGLLVEGSELRLKDVGLNATRTGLLEILEEYDASVDVQQWSEKGGEPVGTLVVRSGGLSAIQAGEQPTRVGGSVIPRLIDELVVLAAVASQAEGITEIRDAGELRVKESDRIAETVRVLDAFGVGATALEDGLTIRGPQALQPASLDVSSDHRVALTAAVLACAAPGTSRLKGFDVAAVSYPGFSEDLQRLGGRIVVHE